MNGGQGVEVSKTLFYSDSVFNAGIIEFMKGGRANEKVI